MSTASKLQIKADHRVVVLDKPDDVHLNLVSTDSIDEVAAADAVLAFVTAKADLATDAIEAVLGAGRRDVLAWVASKGGLRGTDLNRDILANILAERGVRAVRQISVDDTWSALRFRPAS